MTGLSKQFFGDEFNENEKSTEGVNFNSKSIVAQQRDFKLQLWDTAGNRKTHEIVKSYYRGAHGFILMYDVTDYESVEHIPYWIGAVQVRSFHEYYVKYLVFDEGTVDDLLGFVCRR